MLVNLTTYFIFLAWTIRANLHSIVWPADRDEVTNWERRLASLHYKSANESTLGYTNNVELSFAEDWVFQYFLACFFRLFDHGWENRWNDTVANFDTLGDAACALSDFVNILNDLGLIATLFKSMKNDGRNGFVCVWADTFYTLEWIWIFVW